MIHITKQDVNNFNNWLHDNDYDTEGTEYNLSINNIELPSNINDKILSLSSSLTINKIKNIINK